MVRESTLAATWKRDTRGNVGFDDAGDDIDARTLRGDDAMDARGARHLRDARDGHFNIGRRDQHQVGQLVDDDDDVAELFRNDDVVFARHDDFFVQFDRETVGAWLRLFPFSPSAAVPALAVRQRFVLRAFVEGFDIAHADLGENLVALFHFVHDPAQREDHFLRIGDDGHDQVRQRVVLLQLDDLRIDHHEAKLVGRETVKQRGDDGVDANRFARAGAAGDEQVRHFREVGDDRMAVNIFAQRERNARFGVAAIPPIRAGRA